MKKPSEKSVRPNAKIVAEILQEHWNQGVTVNTEPYIRAEGAPTSEWVGEAIFIEGWEATPTEIKVAMINMAWAIKRALDAGWKPDWPAPIKEIEERD